MSYLVLLLYISFYIGNTLCLYTYISIFVFNILHGKAITKAVLSGNWLLRGG